MSVDPPVESGSTQTNGTDSDTSTTTTVPTTTDAADDTGTDGGLETIDRPEDHEPLPPGAFPYVAEPQTIPVDVDGLREDVLGMNPGEAIFIELRRPAMGPGGDVKDYDRVSPEQSFTPAGSRWVPRTSSLRSRAMPLELTSSPPTPPTRAPSHHDAGNLPRRPLPPQTGPAVPSPFGDLPPLRPHRHPIPPLLRPKARARARRAPVSSDACPARTTTTAPP